MDDRDFDAVVPRGAAHMRKVQLAPAHAFGHDQDDAIRVGPFNAIARAGGVIGGVERDDASDHHERGFARTNGLGESQVGQQPARSIERLA
ncbi:MAG: hypothetical protein KatS3mg052_0637 [Candidatus Roseilinea sp.]|nr:MAG: hypothetical protein KatS3mg052_0637 [Candidatus Roseilinea sp.]